MFGGSGNDVYIVDNLGDMSLENENDGVDLVQSSINWTLDLNLENLTLTGTSALNGTGNSLANLVTGNSGANVLSGLDGNDTLNRAEGNDSLNGGVGNDYLNGGAGNDCLDGGAGADTLYGGTGDDIYIFDGTADSFIENADEGYDIIQTELSMTLSFANIEKVVLVGSANINLTGDGLSNALTGNAGANSLSGLDGNDTILGLAGNDTLDGGNGTDSMDGGTGDDSLSGGAGNDTLYGLDGNDTLNGGAGSDKLYGGLGNDTYIVDLATDVISEAANAGTDSVQSSVSFILAANLENLTLTGTAAINGMGNTGANIITGNSGINNLSGNAGNDTLDGLAGNDGLIGGAGLDRLIGGAGNDMLTGGTESDTFVFAAGFGKDTITDFNAATGVNHDVLQFSTAVFANWTALLAATTQVGTDLVITQNASNTIILKNVTLSSFTSDDAIFIA
jgi:Ca2+-binding RTX toxin-like protein